MTKYLFFPLVAAFALVATKPSDASVVAGDWIKFRSAVGSPGGTFHIDNLSNGAGYDFDTFCVELEEYVSFNQTYEVQSITGGTRRTGKTLGSFSAWLYNEYLDGTLTGFTPDATGANTLQFGIWQGMGYTQTDFNRYVGGNFYTTYNTLLSATTWEGEYNSDVASGTWSGTGDIAIMNLRTIDPRTGQYIGHAQDQIIRNPPVPEPGAIVVWSLLSLIGAGFIAQEDRAAIIFSGRRSVILALAFSPRGTIARPNAVPILHAASGPAMVVYCRCRCQ